jgi:hypothetical protein
MRLRTPEPMPLIIEIAKASGACCPSIMPVSFRRPAMATATALSRNRRPVSRLDAAMLARRLERRR